MPQSSNDLAAELAEQSSRLAALERVAGDSHQLAAEILRAARATAATVEQIVEHGVRLRDPPEAVWGE